MSELKNTGYIPSHIIGIGRGGAIIGALISGNLLEKNHIPFTVFDRKFNKDEVGMRQANLLNGVALGDANLSKVLLVAGDVATGITVKSFKNFLMERKCQRNSFCRFCQIIKYRNGYRLLIYSIYFR